MQKNNTFYLVQGVRLNSRSLFFFLGFYQAIAINLLWRQWECEQIVCMDVSINHINASIYKLLHIIITTVTMAHCSQKTYNMLLS